MATSKKLTLKKILNEGTLSEKKALFQFKQGDSHERVVLKYNLWSRYFFYNYFTSPDADFHEELDEYNVMLYRGDIRAFVNIAFRGAAKTARTKLFVAFVIANDKDHFRKYFRVLSANINNSKQIVTDIYNSLVSPRVMEMYPELFYKKNTKIKTEETQGSFTTSISKVKVISGTVGMDQRGAILEESRPDFQWYEDFENRKTLHSAVITNSLWSNMEEARTGEAVGGANLYTCNYISEAGNVHKLVTKSSDGYVVLIIPIINKRGVLAWPERYTLGDIEQMKNDDEDYEGERLCEPSAGADILFDREKLDKMEVLQTVQVSAGFKIYKKFDPSHRYGSGHDVAGGVGLDSSTSVFIDFDTVPANVAGTFASNTIKPEAFGNEIYREGQLFGNQIAGVENNYGTECILQARNLGQNLYVQQQKDTKVDQGNTKVYGWKTDSLSKPKMISALVKAVGDGLLALNDEALIAECRSYSRNDLMDRAADPRLTTRHFDLLIAAAIAWQMKDFAIVIQNIKPRPKVRSKETIYG